MYRLSQCFNNLLTKIVTCLLSEQISVFKSIGYVVYQGPNQTNQDSIKTWLKHEEPNSTKGRTRQRQEVVNHIPSSSPSEYSLTIKPIMLQAILSHRMACNIKTKKILIDKSNAGRLSNLGRVININGQIDATRDHYM